MTKSEFVKSIDFAEAVVSATTAGFGGSGYSAEFFQDGFHRVLWDSEIGNRYESTGEIVAVPKLSDEQVAEQDEENGVSLLDVAKFYQDELAERFLQED